MMTNSVGGMGRAWRWRVVASALALTVVASSFPAFAQDDVPDEADLQQLEELKVEREENLEDAAESVELIDVATATVDEVTLALDELNAYVRLQEGRLEDAERSLQSARDAVEAAEADQRRVEDEMDAVRAHIVNLAITSFTGESSAESDDMTELVLSDDPGEAARFRHLLQLQTGSLGDGLDRLRALEAEAAQLVQVQAAAAVDAETGLLVVEERTEEVHRARERQATLVTAAETRLESRLAEAAIIQERDEELAELIRDQQASINSRIAEAARSNGVEIPDPVDLDDIVTVEFPEREDEFSIPVHIDIAEATEALFLAAFDDGIELGGWGYRPIQMQIELRAAHCGGSDFDIWHKPVFECAPPTARPGFSMHEQGKAIDFTYRGESIKTTDNPAFQWLAVHAPSYGFVNLEEEPWHWSNDG